MTGPSASYISPHRQVPHAPVLICGRDDYNVPGVEYTLTDPAAKLKLNKLCADIALDYYNNTNDTKLKFVDETFNSYSVGDPTGIWIDCCFKAKDDSSIKHFSAQLQYLHQSGLDLSYFQILEGETEVGCANCTHASPAMLKKEGCNVDRKIVENVKDPKRRKTISDQEVVPISIDVGDENPLQLKFLANPAAQLKFNKFCADIALDCYNCESNTLDCYKRKTNALDYYNCKNNTKFKLAAPEAFNSFTVSTIWGFSISCCFYAKDGPSIKHFNAYLNYSHESGPSVVSCVILEGKIERRGYCTHACTVNRANVENPEDPENYPDYGLSFNWKLTPGDCYSFNPTSPAYKRSSPKYKPAMTG